jgi:uncharacterized protein
LADPKHSNISRLARSVEAGLGRLALWTHRRPWTSLALAALVSVVAYREAQSLRIDTNLAALLPQTFQSVQDVKRLQARFGALGFVVVVAEGDNPDELIRFSNDLVRKAEAHPEFSYGQNQRSDEFFRDRALYYLSLDDLEEVRERIEDRVHFEKAKANPILVDLEDGKPPSLDFSDILKKYTKGRFADVNKSNKEPYYLDREAGVVIVYLKPADEASKLTYAKDIIALTQSMIRDLDPAAYGGLQIRIGGRYKKYEEQQIRVGEDVRFTSTIALALVALYLLVHFRSLSAVVISVLPLSLGLMWTFGLGARLFESLNILTAFAGAILTGLGIEPGIHLLHRYQHEKRSGVDDLTALERTFGNTGRGVVLAGLTTSTGFFAVAISEFRAFHEFGLLAGAGMLLVVVAYATVLPPLLVLAGRLGLGARPVVKPKRAPRPWLRLEGNKATAVFWASSALSLGLALHAQRVTFNYDFASMDGDEVPAYELDTVADRILGHKSTPIVVMTRAEDEGAAADALRERKAKTGPASTIDFVLAQADLVPKDQTEKHAEILKLRKSIEGIDPDVLPESDRKRFGDLQEMTEALPFTQESLPPLVQRQFRTDRAASGDPETRGIVLVYPAVTLSDGLGVLEMAKEVRGIPLPNGQTVSAAGEAMILADVLRLVFEESPRVVTVTLLLVFFAMWALLGNLTLAVLCLLPPLITVVGSLGLLPILGVQLNYINIVLIPVLFGIAVDAGTHLVLRSADPDGGAIAVMAETRSAIIGSTVTSAMGFGALLLARHPGLRSFGQFAMIGLAMSLFAAFVWLTAGLTMVRERRGRVISKDKVPEAS